MSPKRAKAIPGNYRPHHKNHTLDSPERLVRRAPGPVQLWVDREHREVSQISHTRKLDYIHDSKSTQTVRKTGSFSSVRPLNFTQSSTAVGARGGGGEAEGIQSRQVNDDDDDYYYRQRRRSSSISNIRPLDYTQQRQLLSSRSEEGGGSTSTGTRSGSSFSHARPLNYTTLEKSSRAERSQNKPSSISHTRPLNYTQAEAAADHRHQQQNVRRASVPILPKIDHIASKGDLDPASSAAPAISAGARRTSSFSTARSLNYTEVETSSGPNTRLDQTPIKNSSLLSARPLDYTRPRNLTADQIRKRSKALAGRALDYTKRNASASADADADATSIHDHDDDAPTAAAVRTRRSPSISSIASARPLDFTRNSREGSDANEAIQAKRRSSATASNTRALDYTLSRSPSSPSEQTPDPFEGGGGASSRAAAASERNKALACKAQFLDYTRQSSVEYEDDVSESDW